MRLWLLLLCAAAQAPSCFSVGQETEVLPEVSITYSVLEVFPRGRLVQITCHAPNVPPPITYSLWGSRDIEVAKKVVNTQDPASFSINVTLKSRPDLLTYTCRGATTWGMHVASAKLQLYWELWAKPVSGLQADFALLDRGAGPRVEVSCQASSGSPPITYRLVRKDGYIHMQQTQHYGKPANFSFPLTQASYWYQCEAKNDISVQSSPFTLVPPGQLPKGATFVLAASLTAITAITSGMLGWTAWTRRRRRRRRHGERGLRRGQGRRLLRPAALPDAAAGGGARCVHGLRADRVLLHLRRGLQQHARLRTDVLRVQPQRGRLPLRQRHRGAGLPGLRLLLRGRRLFPPDQQRHRPQVPGRRRPAVLSSLDLPVVRWFLLPYQPVGGHQAGGCAGGSRLSPRGHRLQLLLHLLLGPAGLPGLPALQGRGRRLPAELRGPHPGPQRTLCLLPQPICGQLPTAAFHPERRDHRGLPAACCVLSRSSRGW